MVNISTEKLEEIRGVVDAYWVTQLNNAYYAALQKCQYRYFSMMLEYWNKTHTNTRSWNNEEDQALWDFITDTFHCGIEDRLPLMKLNRWLGYIQANLIQRGCTTVAEERDWTRPLFRPLDFTEE